tara:strand:+ start:624 stop:809 length:186 start_codon:yes stop_codon:yes gene_type:complete
MEKPRIVEQAKEALEGVVRKIGGAVVVALENHDDSMDVYGSDDIDYDYAKDERLFSEQDIN